jgi:putative flippase GtrA
VFFELIDFEFIAAVLANAYGLIFNFCFACAFVLSDKQPKSAGSNNKKRSSHFPKATVAFNHKRKTNVVQIINTVMGTIVLVIIMKKFEIPSIPPTTSKSIRFPNDLIEKVETAISGTTCTFTAFVIEAVRVALENLEEDETDSK